MPGSLIRVLPETYSRGRVEPEPTGTPKSAVPPTFFAWSASLPGFHDPMSTLPG